MSRQKLPTQSRRALVLAVVAATVIAGVAPALGAGATVQETSTESTVEVSTLAPDPGETNAYLGGNLTAIDGADGANLTIEYRRVGASDWRQADDVEPRQSPDSYYVNVVGLEEGTTYEYRARADTWDGDATDVGDVRTVTTADYPAVETGDVVGVDESSFAVRSNLTDLGGTEPGTIRLEYRATDSSGWFETAEERRAEQIGGYSLKADGLDADTEYEFRTIATSADGARDYGERQTVRTDAAAAVRTGDAHVSGTEATLSAAVASIGGAAEGTVHFEYRLQGADSWTETAATDVSSATRVQAALDDLTAGETYVYRAVLQTSDGDGDVGDRRQFTVAAAPVVATNGTSDVTDADAMLHGSLLDVGSSASVQVGAEYRARGSTEWTSSSLQYRTSTGSFATPISELQPGTSYEYRAVAVGDEERVAGSVHTVVTDTAPAVSTGSATDVESTSATLAGSVDDLGGADALDVGIEYRQQGASDWHSVDAGWLQSADEFSVTVDDLQESTAYEFRTVAVANDGVVATGAVERLETASSTSPPSVETVRATEDSPPNPHAEIAVDWSVADEDGDLASVTVELRTDRGRLVDQWRPTVAGSSAAGTQYAKVKHGAGERYELTVSVTDAEGSVDAERTTVQT